MYPNVHDAPYSTVEDDNTDDHLHKENLLEDEIGRVQLSSKIEPIGQSLQRLARYERKYFI
eukprot:3303196-Pyramimonas_sp.AAC.1